MKKKTILIITMFVAGTTFTLSGQTAWKSLFNGKNLKGWVQLNGKADYYVENGELIGETVMNSPNSFLCTKALYGDFILEFDVLLDAPVNSGVQIRSESNASYDNGRVHGYQVEIDPSDRRWTGGIYDEARRGWLYNLERNPKGKEAYQTGKWNHFRVEAIGPFINTWVNGIQCAALVDDMTPEGFIGLQVHGIGKDQEELDGKKIHWKNIRIITDHPEKYRTKPDMDVPEISFLNNTLTEREKAAGWKLLWDGKTTTGWRGAKLDHFPASGWVIDDGILTVLESGGGESSNGGDIITDSTYGNFILQVDFRITKGANSGIKYFVDPELNKGPGSAIGCEFQILDNANHPDAKKGVDGNRTLGALYDLIPPETKPVLRGYLFNGIGKWNRAMIVVNGCHVTHYLNNIKIVKYERCSQEWRALVAYSKYRKWPHFGEAPKGYILLQDHGNQVSFRNIKILETQ